MALYTVDRQPSKLEILAKILSRGLGGFQKGKEQKRQIGRQEEQDELKAALMQAQTGQAQRANIPQPTSGADQINRLKLGWLQSLPPEEQAAALERMVTKPSSVTNVNLGKPASPGERTDIAKGRASIDSLDNLKTLFDNSRTKTGFLSGRIQPTLGLAGLTSDEQEAFMAATSAFKNAIIKEITGAQMSEVEAERIMKQVPDITDPPARWKAKWEQSKKNLQFLQKRRIEVLAQSGLNAPTGKTAKPIDQMTTEEIEAELKGLK